MATSPRDPAQGFSQHFLEAILPSREDSPHPAWERLLQAYEFEFSTITGKTPDEQGRMALDTELSTATLGWILREGLAPVGLAAAHDHGDSREMAEFYIVPSRRKSGLGRKLARMIFDRFPGPWEVKQLPEALAAQRFWGRTLDSLPCQNLIEDRFQDPYWGPVVRQRFLWMASSEPDAA